MDLCNEHQQLLTIINKLYISFVWFSRSVLLIKSMKDRQSQDIRVTDEEKETILKSILAILSRTDKKMHPQIFFVEETDI